MLSEKQFHNLCADDITKKVHLRFETTFFIQAFHFQPGNSQFNSFIQLCSVQFNTCHWNCDAEVENYKIKEQMVS